MKKALLILLFPLAALAQPTTPLSNLRIAGTNNVVVDSASIKFGTTTPGNISGAAGALTLAAAGTNQSITITPSGSGNFVFKGVTLVGTNATIQTFPTTTATLARTDAAQSFTGIQTILSTATVTFGATSAATIGSSADTTAGNLVLTSPSSGGFSLVGGAPDFKVTNTATAAGTTTLTTASAYVQIFTGSTTQNVQMPAANLRGAGHGVAFIINNQSSGTVTLLRAGSDTFPSAATSFAVTAGVSVTVISDGISFWSVN